jgi:two-component system response regulator PilR (NtrC family)
MSKQKVLIVDDEPDIRELLDITLSRMGLNTHCAANLREAEALVRDIQPDLCLTDMRLPDGNGISLVEYIQQEFPEIPVAMITAHGSVEAAISALKAGAFDFISKPIELDVLRSLVTSALNMDGDTIKFDASVDHELIGTAPAINALRKQIFKISRSQAPVHISGESGSGKEVVARLVHNNGPRASGAFVAVNCGAIPPELMESELFGHVKGSFTGATQDKTGLFQAAAGGTLFLDEVADLPLLMQVKLLRAIQEKSIRPVGASQEQPTDVRLLSATHKNLAAEVEAGHFRNDLYYRINVIGLRVPALRERPSDIPLLADVLLQRIAEVSGDQAHQLDEAAIEALKAYSFPGNVRELENVLERACTMSSDHSIGAGDLHLPDAGSLTEAPAGVATDWTAEAGIGNLDEHLENIERDILTRALEESRWNKTAAARLLGISFRSLRYRLKKLNLDD